MWQKVLKYSLIHSHHFLIGDVLLMKRERNDHPFSFDEYFDENMISVYRIDIQRKQYAIYQIITLLSIIKSVETVYHDYPRSQTN